MNSHKIVQLLPENEIGKGSNRTCFEYPQNLNRCIKITHGNNRETLNEIKYYKILQKKNISWKFLSKYYGSIETSLGKGEIYDLIRDYDGKVSKTLSYYLQKDERTKKLKNIIELLNSLKQYTFTEGIVVKDLNTKNILYQKIDQDNVKLILIDGVSNNDYLPFSKYFVYFRNKKIQRLWNRFECSLPEKYSYNKYFLALLKKNLHKGS